MSALAHAFVRPLLESLCEAIRSAASRVVGAAAEGRDDPEAIHDYRVSLRRLRTLLASSEKLFKRRPLALVADGLRDLARTAGAVRDEEVLEETLAELELPAATRARLTAWMKARSRKERALRAAVIRELKRTRGEPPGPREGTSPENGPPAERAPAPAFEDLLALARSLPLRRRASALSTRAVALKAVHRASRRTLAQAARPDAEGPEGLHKLRIRWKGVRYAAELFSKAFAKDDPVAGALARLVKTATRMQKRLGETHDIDEAIGRVARARALSLGDRMVIHHRLRGCREALEARLEKELPEALSLLSGGDAESALA